MEGSLLHWKTVMDCRHAVTEMDKSNGIWPLKLELKVNLFDRSKILLLNNTVVKILIKSSTSKHCTKGWHDISAWGSSSSWPHVVRLKARGLHGYQVQARLKGPMSSALWFLGVAERLGMVQSKWAAGDDGRRCGYEGSLCTVYSIASHAWERPRMRSGWSKKRCACNWKSRTRQAMYIGLQNEK